MKEVKLYGAVLVVLMVLAYLSWTRDTEKVSEEKATIASLVPDQITGLELFTKTQTVAMSYRDLGGERQVWFDVDSRGKKRGFVGNEEVPKLLEKFAPFDAIRSLGRDLNEKELEQTGLKKPERKLVIRAKGGDKTYDLGGVTSGARDHYVRAKNDREVFIVAARTLGDLEQPESKYMQRKLRAAKLEKVEKVVISAGERKKTAIQKNRLAAKEAFWVSEEKPEEKDEALGTFIDRIEKLTAIEYPEDGALPADATPVLEVAWLDESGKSLGTLKLLRQGVDKKAEFWATSAIAKLPVKVSRFTADQVEKDLGSILGD